MSVELHQSWTLSITTDTRNLTSLALLGIEREPSDVRVALHCWYISESVLKAETERAPEALKSEAVQIGRLSRTAKLAPNLMILLGYFSRRKWNTQHDEPSKLYVLYCVHWLTRKTKSISLVVRLSSQHGMFCMQKAPNSPQDLP